MANGEAGRPQWQYTEEDQIQVVRMAKAGIPRKQIAQVFGICEATLDRHMGDLIRRVSLQNNVIVAESLFNRAIGDGRDAVTAAIWWEKTRTGLRDHQQLTISGDEDAPLRYVSDKPLTEQEWDQLYGAGARKTSE
jgi:DNA-binding CsgD family transcriptional regulator